MELVPLVIFVIVLVSTGLGFIFGNMFPLLQPFLSDDSGEGDSELLEISVDVPGIDIEEADEEIAPVISIEEEELVPVEEVQTIVPEPKTKHLELVEIVRLFRDPQEYKLHIVMDGMLVQNTHDLDREQIRSLSKTVGELDEWVKALPEVGDSSLDPVNDTIARSKPIVKLAPTFVEPDVKEMTMNPLKAIANILQRGEKKEHIKRDIASEINMILQKNISGTELVKRDLQIQKAADGSLAFVVGKTLYAYMDEIDEPLVKDALQQAIKDWEAQ